VRSARAGLLCKRDRSKSFRLDLTVTVGSGIATYAHWAEAVRL
jgi:hypothetical protein